MRVRPRAVVEVNHPVAEAPFVEQLEIEARTNGECPRAAADHDGREEEADLVDQPGPDTSSSGAAQSKFPSSSATYPSSDVIAE